MKTYLIYIVIFSSILVLGCNHKSNVEKNTNNSSPENKEFVDSIKNQIIINEMLKKYSINYILDTIKHKFSIEFEALFNNKYQAIKFFMLKDIYKKDSSYFLKIETGVLTNYLLDLKISNDLLQKIVSSGPRPYAFEGIMIISLEKIHKFDFNIRNNNEMYTINSEDLYSFGGNGEVIDFKIKPI